MRGLALGALLLASCSLIVAPDVDAGSADGGAATGGGSQTGGGTATGGGASTGGGTATGGGAATGGGSAAGGGSATGGGTNLDGGPGCGSDGLNRLACTVVKLYDGGIPDVGLMAANDGGWLALVGSSTGTMQLLQIDQLRHVNLLADVVSDGGIYSPTLGAEGAHWVIGWAPLSSATAGWFNCETDLQTTPVPVSSTFDSSNYNLALGIDSIGNIAAVTVPSNDRASVGYGVGACPPQVSSQPQGTGLRATGAGVVHVPGTGIGGFLIPVALNNSTWMRLDLIATDGGIRSRDTAQPGYLSATLSGDATSALIAFSVGGTSLCPAAISTNGSGTWTVGGSCVQDFSNWQVTAMGNQRFALNWVTVSPHHLKVMALDGVNPSDEYDVACNVPTDGAMGVASSGQELGFLVPRTGGGADLYVCPMF